MRRRINSTGRHRIERNRIDLHAVGENGFGLALDLAPMQLPEAGKIVVEAHVQSLTERFGFGTVARPQADTPLVLQRLGIDDATFRIKVVERGSGRLLARADRLRIGDDGGSGRRELLAVRVRDLGPEPWRTELMPTGEPCLVLNESIPDAASRVTSDRAFQALVLPAAFRQVLHLLWSTQEQIEGDGDDPVSRWLAFAEALTGEDVPDWEDREQVLGWIDRACRQFAGRHDFLSVFTEAGRA